ncbi:outer membrane beta-barrel protein [Sphingomonas sp. G-3-2-10]|uniref:outer membrane protein n=1 Tax=Sphingomonas sp. G-3-2-10 TaxID=2728838 RepID=UPI00146A4FC6|nr:outer membrane beta-barrel protein [Sphingomonas sp. G-3-2-10]NML06116.1 porin family protein [Sphingomonas sp. G-3-2-10]
MKLLLLGAASLLAATAPAYAQESSDAEFNGPYIGASVGYSFQNNDAGETILFDRDLNGSFGDTVVTSAPGAPNAFSPGFCNGAATSTANVGCANDKDGINYSARLGWDVQFGNIVAGVVLEGGKTDITDSVSGFSTTPARYTMTREIDWNAGARLRLGYVAGGRTLFYGTGGGAYAKVDHTFSTSNTANSFTGRGKNDVWGWAAGGGVEQKVGKNFSFGVEYLYTRYNDDDYTVRAGPGTAPATNPFLLGNASGTDFRRSDTRFDHHGIKATANFRF